MIEAGDPWVETTDEFGRTRIARKSELFKFNAPAFVKGDEEEQDEDEERDRLPEPPKRELGFL